MWRIDTDGATAEGHFKTTPAPATVLGADWLNIVQGELCNIVENALGGDRALELGNAGQLLESILAIVGRALQTLVTVDAAATGQIAIGGIIVKWGGYRETITDEVSRSVVFGTEFPTACWRIFTQPGVASAGDHQDLWTQTIFSSISKTGFSVQFQDDDSSDSRSAGFDWLAIGN